MLDHAPVALRHPGCCGRYGSRPPVAGFRAALDARGFTEIQTPKIVGSATESGANVFALDYFGQPAYLAQSPQFYKQIMVGVFERVYEVGPVFRAEPHDTARHLAQYASLDAEFGFIDDHRDGDGRAARSVTGMVATVGHARGRWRRAARRRTAAVPRAHPRDALRRRASADRRGADWDPRGEPDLAPADERWLGEWAVASTAATSCS